MVKVCNISVSIMKMNKYLLINTLISDFLFFLSPQIKHESDEFDWGVILNFKKQDIGGGRGRGRGRGGHSNPARDPPKVVVEVLLHVLGEEDKPPKPCPPGTNGEMEVVPVLSSLITKISSLRIHVPKDLRPPDNKKSVYKTLQVRVYTTNCFDYFLLIVACCQIQLHLSIGGKEEIRKWSTSSKSSYRHAHKGRCIFGYGSSN